MYLCFRSLTMDKGWIKVMIKFSVEYREGVSQFLEIFKFHIDAYEQIRCPSKRCMYSNWDSLEGVEQHLLTIGISLSYTEWMYHGEVLKDFMKELVVTLWTKKMKCLVCLMIYKLRLNTNRKQRKVWRMRCRLILG